MIKTKRNTAIRKELRDQIGRKSKVQGIAKANAMIVHGDPDKIEIGNLKRLLGVEKAAYSELKGELGLLKTKLVKEKRMARASMHRLEEMVKRYQKESHDLRAKLDDHRNHHHHALENLEREHDRNLKDVVKHSNELQERAVNHLNYGHKHMLISRKTMEEAAAREDKLRRELEEQRKSQAEQIKRASQREIDRVKAQYEHSKEQDRKEFEFTLQSFKDYHKERMEESEQYKEELTTLYKHCNGLTKMVKRMEMQAYPVRVKGDNLKMFVIPQEEKPAAFQSYMERRKVLKASVDVVEQYTNALSEYEDPPREETTEHDVGGKKEAEDIEKIAEKYVPGLRQKHLEKKLSADMSSLSNPLMISNVSTFVRHVEAAVPEREPFVYNAPPHLLTKDSDCEKKGGDPLEHEVVIVGHADAAKHRAVKDDDAHLVVRHVEAAKLLIDAHEDDHDDLAEAAAAPTVGEKDERVEAEDVTDLSEPHTNETPTETFLRRKRLRARPKSANPPTYNRRAFLNITGPKKISVHSSNRPETARAVLSARNTGNTFVLSGSPRSGGFGSRTARQPTSANRKRQSPVWNARVLRQFQGKAKTGRSAANGAREERKKEAATKEKAVDVHHEIKKMHAQRRKKGTVPPRRQRNRPASASLASRLHVNGRVRPSSGSPRARAGHRRNNMS